MPEGRAGAVSLRRPSGCFEHLLPAGGLWGLGCNPLESIQIGDVIQAGSYGFFGCAKAIFAQAKDDPADTLLLSFVENHQVGVGFLHGTNSSKDPCRGISP